MPAAGASTLTPALFNAAPSASTGGNLPGDLDWSSWLGTPEIPADIKPIELQNRSTWTLHTAYRGKSEFLGTTFALLALSNNSFLTAVILPLKITNSLKFNATRYEFPAVLPDVVPDLGVVREVKNNFLTQQASLTRYGLGLQMQHGFMTTEEGRMCYVYHIRQIHQGMMEGLQFECLYELLNNGNWAINTQTKLSSWDAATAESALDRVIQNEADTWAITQITDKGDVQMDVHIESINALLGGQPLTTYIMDSRIRTYLNTIRPLTSADITSNEKYKFGINENYVDTRGNRTFVTRTLLVDGKPFNPLERVAQIGEFVISKDSETNVSSYQNYLTEDRTISIYSDDHDDWKQITLQECHNNSYRFHPTTEYLRDFSNRYEDENMENRENDHLFHRVGKVVKPISFFGQMRPEHYTTGDYECMAESVIASISRNNPKMRNKITSAIAGIGRILTIMHSVPRNENYNLWLRALALKNPGIRTNRGDNVRGDVETVEFASNGYNSWDIPVTRAEYERAFTGKAWADIRGSMTLPPTHGSYGGLKTIADLVSSNTWTSDNVPFNAESVAKLPKYMSAFDQFVDQLANIFPNSAFSQPRNASNWVAQPKPHDIIFENLFHLSHPSRPIFVRLAIVAPDGDLPTGSRAKRTWDEVIPALALARQQLQARVLGPIYLGKLSDARVGDAMGNTGRVVGDLADDDVVWRYGPDNTSYRAWTGGAVPVAGTPIDVDMAIEDDPKRKVYREIMRAAVAGYNTPTEAAYNAVVMTMLGSVQKYSDIDALAQSYKKVIDALQAQTGMQTGAAPLVMNEDQMIAMVIRIIRQTAAKEMIPGALKKDLESIFKGYFTAARTSPARDVQYGNNIAVDQYYRAPIFMGRAAAQSFVNSNEATAVYGIPASHNHRDAMMTGSERLAARTYLELASSFANGANHTDYSKVGEIFEPASRTTARLDIKNLPLVRKLLQSYDAEYHGEQTRQRRGRESAFDNTSRSFLRSTTEKTKTRSGLSWEGLNSKDDSYRKTVKHSPAIDRYSEESFASAAQNVGEQEITSRWKDNFASLVKTLSGVHLMISLFFMFESVVKSSLDRLIRCNVMFPWQFIIARPHCTWNTLTTIKCRPGEELGNSYLAKIEVEMSDDTSVHVMRGNVNYWSGALIKDSKLCFNLHNSYVCGYRGGQGIGFMNPETYQGTFGTPEDPNASIMCFTIPLHEQINDRCISITGAPTWQTREGTPIDISMIKNKFGYSSSGFYTSHYGFKDVQYSLGTGASTGPARYRGHIIAPNALCGAAAAVYRSTTTHMPRYISSQRLHWKNNQVGKGAHAARIGRMPFDYSKQGFASNFENISVC